MTDGSDRPIRVVIADDSATVRAVVRRILRAGGMEVVGEAEDGVRALELVRTEDPDLVLLDLDMPRLDGAESTRRILEAGWRPVVILTARADPREFIQAARALEAGALEVLPKPATPASWEELEFRLVQLIRSVAGGRLSRAGARDSSSIQRDGNGGRPSVLVVGASTGGPAALRDLLVGLGSGVAVPIVIVQHIARGFEPGLAEWLARETGIRATVARQGETLAQGEVRVAPGGAHLRLDPELGMNLDSEGQPRNGHRPSVDELFLSAAEHRAQETAAVLLTGMGCDGAEGLARIHAVGGVTIAQEPSTCAVAGMPMAAISKGAARFVLAPREAGELVRRLVEGREAP